MRIATPVLQAITVGASRIIPEVGDSEPVLVQQIHATIETLSQTSVVGPANNVEADNSVISSSRTNIPASSSAGTTTVSTLKKGLYTIDVSISGRFVGTPAPSGVPDVRIEIVDEALTNAVDILTMFAQTLTSQTANRRIRLCLPGTFLIRRRTEATGVGQTMELGQSFSIERHL